ncbi:MAG: cobalamin biosynthesis protein [Desulfomonile tiedjei]|uniref:Cobalamin biosynthesis protein n=1 Tax=Desulfomonile tiedjei TaxID=2358 RepID=A0A9D6V4D1_9BACT|nr:cobalamin biosynthesis protein [Desulfomonile tiedjei]
MKLAAITLSAEGAKLALRLAEKLSDTDVYVHAQVEGDLGSEKFDSVVDLTGRIFDDYNGLIYIMPCGVVVRSIAPCLKHKTQDPAVVVVDVMARWAVSLLSGHEGGANDLAVSVGNILSAEPIVSTTTEAVKTLIVGIGCRRGVESHRISAAIRSTLADANLDLDHVRLLSSADIKHDESGLISAAQELGIPLRFISSEEIRNAVVDFQHSDFVEEQVNLPAVAEPCALLAGRRTKLIIRKKTYNGITVAVAQESSL